MNTSKTIEEETRLDKGQNEIKKAAEESPKKKNASFLGSTAVGLGTGVLLGSATSFVITNAMAGNVNSEQLEKDSVIPSDSGSITDGSVHIASGITDEMSFPEAFSTARAELGTGAAFEWRGNVYSTFTAEEWNSMSDSEKDEYFSHFNWSDDSVSPADSADSLDTAQEDQEVQVEPEVESANEPVDMDDVQVEDPNPEVEILGIEQDPASGSKFVGLMVDNQEVILVDVDGEDNHFEYMAADLNRDGKITDNEIVDISGDHIEVSQFENDLYHNGQMLDSVDDGAADYINDDHAGCDMP